MTDKFQNRYRIPSARATWHDYNDGCYFITICTKNREHYFGEIVNHEMILSEIGEYTVENMEQITNHYPDCEIPVFVAMPNHLHAIVVINGGGGNGGNGGNGGDGGNGGCCRDDVHIVCTLSPPSSPSLSPPSSPSLSPPSSPSLSPPSPPSSPSSPPPPLSPSPLSPPSPSPNNLRWKNDRVDEKMQLVSHRRGRMSVVMGGFKRAITQYAHHNNIEFAWQERFYDHIIHDDAEYRRIEEYIIHNPANWQTDQFYKP